MIELDVHTKGGPMLEKFQELNISEVIIRALNEMGFGRTDPDSGRIHTCRYGRP